MLRRYGHVDIIPLSNGVQGNPADVVDIRADVVLDIVRSQRQNGSESLLERIEWWLEEGGDELSWFSNLIQLKLNITAVPSLWKPTMHSLKTLFH